VATGHDMLWSPGRADRRDALAGYLLSGLRDTGQSTCGPSTGPPGLGGHTGAWSTPSTAPMPMPKLLGLCARAPASSGSAQTLAQRLNEYARTDVRQYRLRYVDRIKPALFYPLYVH
jgi:hypothetical protein